MSQSRQHTRNQSTQAFVAYIICNCVNAASAIGTDPPSLLLLARLAMCDGRKARKQQKRQRRQRALERANTA